MPAVSTATPWGSLRPVNGSTVGVFDPAANFNTRLLTYSVTYTLPAVSTATPAGSVRTVNGSTVCGSETGVDEVGFAALVRAVS